MARLKKYKLEDFPGDGMVFAMPLRDGRIGVCRILRKEIQTIPCALVAVSDWIGNEPPPLEDPAIRRILVKTHYKWSNIPEVMWVMSPPPPEFRALGLIRLLPEDTKAQSDWYGGWNSFPNHVLLQWRWDHEREALLAEDAAREKQESINRGEAEEKRSIYLASLTFSQLLEKDLFPTWDEYPGDGIKRECQNVIQTFIHTLNQADQPVARKFAADELKKCIKQLNLLDAQNKHFIETEEREHLHLVLEDVLHVARQPGLVDKIEVWRKW